MKNHKGIALIMLIIAVAIIIVAIILFIPKDDKTNKTYEANNSTIDAVGKSTTDYTYLLNHKPTSEQISSATTIDYRSLYKGANTLNGNFYNITGEIIQQADEHIYHINMTKKGTEPYSYYTDRIQISVIGTPGEILMEGDIVSFTGESLGNYTYYTVLGSESTVPFIRVYAENLRVIGHTD